MKKITLAVSLMLGALSFAGCHYDIVDKTAVNDDMKIRKLTITSSGAEAVNYDGTRTEMTGNKADGFNTAWVQATDKLGVYTVNADVNAMDTRNIEFGITSLTDGIATFEGDIRIDSENRTYDLYAYYPYASFNQFMTHDMVAKYVLNEQTMPSNGTHDPANDYMIAAPQQLEVAGGQILNAEIDNFRFRYLVGFMNLTIKDITAAGITAGDEVNSVKITAKGDNPAVTGDYYLDISNGNEVPVPDAQYGDVTVNLPAGVTLGDLDAWAVVVPFAAEEITFLITTATHTIEKTAIVAGFKIAAGGIKTFNMTVNDDCTITPIESITIMPYVDLKTNYGDYYGNGTNNFTIAVTDIDFSGSGYSGSRVEFDFYSPAINAGPFDEFINIPAGSYEFKSDRSEFSVRSIKIRRYENGKAVLVQTVASGMMTIEGDASSYTITFDAVCTDATGFVAKFVGPIVFENPNYWPFNPDNLELTHAGGMYYGDEYGEGTTNIYIIMHDFDPNDSDNNTGTMITMDLILPRVNESPVTEPIDIPAGTYPINESGTTNTVLVGDYTNLIAYIDGNEGAVLPVTGGFVTIEGNNSNYTITFEVEVEGLGKIQNSYTGPLEVSNPDLLP